MVLLEPHVLSLIVTLLGTLGLTEPIKRAVRSTRTTRDDWLPRVLAVGIGAGLGHMLWPQDTNVPGGVIGAIIGMFATTAYAVLVAGIRIKWPGVADAITGSKEE